MKFLNICILKPFKTSQPFVFEDSAQAFQDTLTDLGFQSVISYNTIDPRVLNVVFGLGSHNTVSLADFAKIASPKHTVIFNMEQLGSQSLLLTDGYFDLLSNYIVLDYNQANLDSLKVKRPQSVGFEFPLAPSSRFLSMNEPVDTEIKYDLGFYGARSPKRDQILEDLESQGLRIKRISGAYGEFLSHAILDCRAILNLHWYETGIFETARALRPIAHGIPIFSEKSVLPRSINWLESGTYFFHNYMEIVNTVQDSDFCLKLIRRNIFFVNQKRWLETASCIMKNLYSNLP